MKFLADKIDRFCLTHKRFGIQRLMIYIVAASAAVLVLSLLDTRGTLLSVLMFDPGLVLNGEVWRVVTWVFMPLGSSNLLFSALALYFYYFIGTSLEREWGAGKLTIFYISGIVLNVAYSLLMYVTGLAQYIFLDPMYLNLSMFFAFATLFPEHRVMLFFVIPVKIKWLAWLDAALFAYQMYSAIVIGAYFYALVPVVAVLNFLLICGVPIPRVLQARMRTATHRRERDNVIDVKFRGDEAYRHKCEVCSRTEVSNPELEFRYCSRCEGFLCYCEEHIDNHIHK
ncbi:MAG: rhomboid family intramembrane serine protease [Oscillospiraceae bacterium]|nr:rhomboid family intramembrane serine protease [Oscillospiraceae bacterium]